jgi:uncharacterized protein (TIGR00290 family)
MLLTVAVLLAGAIAYVFLPVSALPEVDFTTIRVSGLPGAKGNTVRPIAWVSWSSGKDSAWSLHTVRERGESEVVGLLTTVNRTQRRVAMHAVRESLLEAQATEADSALNRVPIPALCTNEEYESAMGATMDCAKSEGVTHFIFGDLFLEDIRRHREEKLARSRMVPVFPFWGKSTRQLAHEMLAGGLRSCITCVDTQKLNKSFVGREWNAEFLTDLPLSVDACGENGEFHTFAFAGPMFRRSLSVRRGRIAERDSFAFADFLPEDQRFVAIGDM